MAAKNEKVRSMKSAKVGEAIFVHLMLLYPLVQFAICYVAVNINSILLAFQKYETYMNAALNEFVSDTGLTVSVYVADVESVFSRSNKMWIVLILGIISLAIGVGTIVFAVRAIKKRKEAKNNSAHMNVKTDNGDNSDGNDFNF